MKLQNVDDIKNGKLLWEFGFLFMILNFLCAAGIWQSILSHWQVAGEETIFSQAMIGASGPYGMEYMNQKSLYLSLLSLLFSFLGNKEWVVLAVNLIMQLASVLFLYAGSRIMCKTAASIVMAVIAGIAGGCFFPVVRDTPMHLIWFLCAVVYWVFAELVTEKKSSGIRVVLFGILGFLVGSVCYADLAGVFLLLSFAAWSLYSGTWKHKNGIIEILFFYLTFSAGFLRLMYLWNESMISGAVWKRWLWDRCCFWASDAAFRQYGAMAAVYLCGIFFSAVFVVRSAKNDTSVTNGGEIYLEDEAEKREKKEIRKEESKVSEDTQSEEADKDASPSPIRYIENPLPLPKKHIKKEMTYAFEPKAEQMHYDLNNYRTDDDYDLKL